MIEERTFPEGLEGEQHSPRDVHFISRLSTPQPPSECCMSSRKTPKQTGTGLNPTENTFGGDPEKMFNSDESVRVEHLRPHAPRAGIPA